MELSGKQRKPSVYGGWLGFAGPTNYARDHSVADGLNHVATWNAAMLQSDDLMAAMMAGMSKQQPQFKD